MAKSIQTDGNGEEEMGLKIAAFGGREAAWKGENMESTSLRCAIGRAW